MFSLLFPNSMRKLQTPDPGDPQPVLFADYRPTLTSRKDQRKIKGRFNPKSDFLHFS